MKKLGLAFALLLLLCFLLTGCGEKPETGKPEAKKSVTIRIKCLPMTMAYDADHPNAEIYDLLTEAAEKFSAQYKDAEVKFIIEKFQYADEKAKVVDKIGTAEAADIFFGGSFNLPTYILENRLVSWDDMIDKELRGDVDDAIWRQCMANGKTYLMPYGQLQNNLMVNAAFMRKAGLGSYIPPKGSIAEWSTPEFNTILRALKRAMPKAYTFPLFAYAANNQGDIHTMALLRAYGCQIFSEDGKFAVHTPEGVQALKWLKELSDQEILPKGAENIELMDNIELFYNEQLAICFGNRVNLNDCRNLYHLDVFLANFPSLDGKGYATSYLNGFILFDNGDAEVIRAAKAYIRFIYSNRELLRYSLSSTPVLKSYVAEHKDEVEMMQAYSDNSSRVVDFLHNTPRWEAVRAAFYPNMQDLYRGAKTPAETAAAIDKSCNAAAQGAGEK